MDLKAIKARDWKAYCIVCGREFDFKDGFECLSQPGHHTVDLKIYYHLGAGHIQSIRDRRLFSPMLNLHANREVRDKVTGEIANVAGVVVWFKESGLYETTDPEEQYYLDQHASVMTGEEGRQEWEKMYLTPQQQLAKAQQKLADTQRQVREQNALLDAAKAVRTEKKNALAM